MQLLLGIKTVILSITNNLYPLREILSAVRYDKSMFLLTLSIIALFSSTSAFAEIETKAKFAYLYDYDTGEVLLDKEGDESMAPSSMTKLMTLYLLFSSIEKGEISLETEFPISETAWRKGGSKMYVKEGDTVKVEDLIRGIIIASGNDACIVVAEGMAGSEEAFAEDMNFMAEKIGLTNSHFKNSNGWPDEEHRMTAHDLVTLSIRLFEDFPDYYHYFSEKSFKYSNIKQPNRNRLIYKNIGVDGFKTGYTVKAGYGIVVSAERKGRRLFLAINGLTSSKERLKEAERLIHRGFADYKKQVLFEAGSAVENANVWGGVQNSVPLTTKEDVIILSNRRISERKKFSLDVTYKSPLYAPIARGSHVADLTIRAGGEVQKTVPLYAGVEVAEQSFVSKAISKFKYMIFGY